MVNQAGVVSQIAIDVCELYKSFDGKPAVNGISLKVNQGEIFGFLGPNGGGKTTTIRMICGLLTPDKGKGTCLGYDIITESGEIKKRVGYMAQKFGLYEDLSIHENLDFVARMYGMQDREKAINEALDFFGLPKSQQKKLAGALSGGWKQRLALAAAILHEPKLLLLDEPTAGVDPKARREFWDEIHRLSLKGITTLVSTHYMDEAERCHRLAYISAGQILVQGTIEDIVSESKLVTWRVQGPDLELLAEQLRAQPSIEQVTNFGNILHVSGIDREKLSVSLQQYHKEDYIWNEITPTLEDIFIRYSTFKESGA